MNSEELSFAVFCVESMAGKINVPAVRVFDMFTKDSDLLYQYIVPCYETLHTQSKEYILNDLGNVMKERGLLA